MGNYIVTGASSGIGLEVSKLLLNQGNIVVAISNDGEQLNAIKEFDCEKCFKITFDLTNLNEIKTLIKSICEKVGKIRGFVHCAGFDRMSPLYLNTPELTTQLLNLHAVSPMLMIGQISRKNNFDYGCSMVLISSLSAHEGASGHTAYAMAKGAVEGLIPSAASELSEKGIRINCVTLGVIETPMSNKWISNLSEEQRNLLNISYPFGLGKIEYVTNMVDFLLSDKAKWITGQNYIVDGGHLSRKI